jgi:hypothetical protein
MYNLNHSNKTASVGLQFSLIWRRCQLLSPVPVAVRSWRRSAAARLLRSWVRILPGSWMFVCCECCVLSGRGLCDELITRPEESYRLWSVVVCDLETARMKRSWPALGRSATEKKSVAKIVLRRWINALWVGSLVNDTGEQCSARRKACPIASLSTTNLTWTLLVLNLGVQ